MENNSSKGYGWYKDQRNLVAYGTGIILAILALAAGIMYIAYYQIAATTESYVNSNVTLVLLLCILLNFIIVFLLSRKIALQNYMDKTYGVDKDFDIAKLGLEKKIASISAGLVVVALMQMFYLNHLGLLVQHGNLIKYTVLIILLITILGFHYRLSSAQKKSESKIGE